MKRQCFGCAQGICNLPKDPENWKLDNKRSELTVGIPYSCYPSQTGCKIAM